MNQNTAFQTKRKTNSDLAQTEKIIAAVDIGTTKIVAIVGKVFNTGKVQVLGMGKVESHGVKRGVVLNIDEAAGAIQDAVEQAEKQSGHEFNDVYVGIAGQHIKSLKNRHSRYINSEDNEIKQHDIDELLKDMQNIALDNGDEIIHVIPQSYTVDKETGVKQPVGMSGKRLEANFHIVVAETASAKNILKSVERAGLRVKQMMLEPIASSMAVLSEDEKEIGVAMVDIGGGTTDIAIYYDGILRHTAVIPFGGYVITRDIKEACGILQRQAEKLKINFGTALGEATPDAVVSVKSVAGRDPKKITLKFLSKIIQARMEEIIQRVNFEIENSGFADKLGAGISLTGGGALLKHLRQLMGYLTGLDTNISYPNYLAETGNKEVNSPMYSTAIGLLLGGYMHELENEANAALNGNTEEEEEEEDFENENYSEEEPIKKVFSGVKKFFSGMFEDRSSEM
ncbi:MAG: cell division protein FtsA [Bacteroidales bacterium]|nr:cell division protein FtsA [Bacteroidales bacterium]